MKQLKSIRKSPPLHWVGDGFPVRSILSPQDPPEANSPFLLLDYAEPYEFEPSANPRGVGEHPHRGFETVTIAYQGTIDHRDSGGNAGSIGPGDVQWMTAASGVVHEELHGTDFTRDGGTFEMIQLWVNLPTAEKMAAPISGATQGADTPHPASSRGGNPQNHRRRSLRREGPRSHCDTD